MAMTSGTVGNPEGFSKRQTSADIIVIIIFRDGIKCDLESGAQPWQLCPGTDLDCGANMGRLRL